jgi:hypothetical protein
VSNAINVELGRFVDRDTMRFERTYPHAVDAVWAALTEPAQMSVWWLPCTLLEPRLNGRYAFGWAHNVYEGRISEFEPGKVIDFSGMTRFELSKAAAGCRVVVTLKRWPNGWNPVSLAGFHGWLDQLALHLEGLGADEIHNRVGLWPAVFPAYEYLIRRNVSDGRTTYRVHFAEDRADLSDEANATLDVVVAFLKANPELRIHLDGYCDERCSWEDSLKLSKKRTGEVATYLEGAGIKPDRLFQTWGGNSHQIVSSESSVGRAFNRRVELRPIY